MASITLKGREIPLLYTVWEMKQVQEEICPLGDLQYIMFGRNKDDENDRSKYAGPEHLNALAKLIRILPERMALGHRPESRYLPAIQERRYLEIAEGNEPTEFSRTACLDLNAAIVSIATSDEGVAVYWKAEGPAILGRGGATGQAGACPSGLPAPIQS